MPSPRKIDLIGEELRGWLREELASSGFADIERITDALNARLEASNQQISIGKSAVGVFSKALKDQREAFTLAETLLTDMDIDAESDLHKVLMQMIATSAVQLIRAIREEDGHLEAKDLMNLGRMLKDLMTSSGLREKLREDERKRAAAEAQDALKAEQAARLDASVSAGEITEDFRLEARRIMGFG